MQMSTRERSAKDRRIPKCKCGNCLSLKRQRDGIKHCPACDVFEDVEDTRKGQ